MNSESMDQKDWFRAQPVSGQLSFLNVAAAAYRYVLETAGYVNQSDVKSNWVRAAWLQDELKASGAPESQIKRAGDLEKELGDLVKGFCDQKFLREHQMWSMAGRSRNGL